MKIVTFIQGIYFRGAEAQAAADALEIDEPLRVEPEPTNQYDPNAVRIITKDGVWIGYVQKDLAAAVCAMIESGPVEARVYSKMQGAKPQAMIQTAKPAEREVERAAEAG